MKVFLAVVAFLAVTGVSVADFESDWEGFKVSYGRNYGSPQEEAFHKELFRRKWEMINEHNKKFEKGEVSWKMGINNFTDWTRDEFGSRLMPSVISYSTSFDSEWSDFKMKFERRYDTSEEEAFRKGIFLKNWEMITEHNKRFEKGEVTWRMGVNNFTDFTQEEFGARLMNPPKFSKEQFEGDWKNFKVENGRIYENSIEEAFRRGIFRWNWERIVEHNRKFERGEVSWKMGVNNFTDWTREEFGSRLMPQVISYSTSFDSEWSDFKMKFERHYDTSEEEAFRKGIFLKNWEMITEHNKRFKKGEVSWSMGVNNFTDFTQAEFGPRLMNPPKFSKEEFEADWKNFKVENGRVYESSVEEAFRRGIFTWNWERIVEHNRRFERGEVSWKMGVNNFTDWTGNEFGNHLMRPITRLPTDV